MKNGYTYLWFLVWVILPACAQVVAPSGGPKDTESPYTIDSLCIPPNFSTSFTGDKIVLRFNEYISLKDARNQIIVSPPMEDAPDFSLKGKKLFIRLNSPLKAHTTYTINFGNAAEDITERNKAHNLKYVFSTGADIDSLRYYGKVRNSWTLQPEENVLVMLYRNLSDSAPMLQKPDYFSKTDKTGAFVIDYVREGDYKVFALRDGNFNYLFDLPDEKLAYKNEPIHLPLDSNDRYRPDELLLFGEDNENQFLEGWSCKPPAPLRVVFHKPPFNPKIRALAPQPVPWRFSHASEKGDTVNYWLEPHYKDSILLEVSDDTFFTDTLVIPVEWPEKKKAMKCKTNIRSQMDWNKKPVFTFSEPVLEVDPERLVLLEDSIPIEAELRPGGAPHKMYLEAALKQGSAYALTIMPDGLKGLYQYNTDTFQVQWKFREDNYYGKLELELELADRTYTGQVQLLFNNKMIREDEATHNSKISYRYLAPGKYGLRLILDRNGDGEWNTGNYRKKIQPEGIRYFDETIEIRSKWSKTIKWILE